MSKIKIRYDGKYYEYNNKELSPELYYDLSYQVLIDLFNQRATHIKDLKMSEEVLKYKADANVEYYREKAKSSLDNIYNVEREISDILEKKSLTYPWYTVTLPRDASKIPQLENQKRYICKNCGQKYDVSYTYNYEKYGITLDEFMNYKCPECKKDKSLIIRNIHIFQASIYQKKAKIQFQNDNFVKSITILDKALNQLNQVNQYDEDDYLSTIAESAIVSQTKARVYIAMCNFEMAYSVINNAVDLWEVALLYGVTRDYDCIAVAYCVRQCCCIQLRRNMQQIIEDGKKIESFLESHLKEVGLPHKTHYEDKTMSEIYHEYETISMLNYISIHDALNYFERPHDEIFEAYGQGIKFLSKCKYLDDDELKNYFNSLSKPLKPIEETPKKTKTKTKEGCYIATAVYGDYDAYPVLVLRNFRDTVLKGHLLGRVFIKLYYKFSPSLAEKLKHQSCINHMVKKVLDRFIKHLECKAK